MKTPPAVSACSGTWRATQADQITDTGPIKAPQREIRAAALISLWGVLMGPVSVIWSAWVARQVPEHAETAGGVFIASIQLSAAVGALAGGSVFDALGSTGVFTLSALSWFLSALVVGGLIKVMAIGAR